MRILKVFALIAGLTSVSSMAHASPLPMTSGNWRAAPRFVGDLVSEAMHFVGSGNITGTQGPWCADFVSFVLRKTGHKPLSNRMAGSALAYGPTTSHPKRGDLIVLGSRRLASHVGIFMGFDRSGQVQMVSGNWSHRVKTALISRQTVLAFVRV